MARRYRPSPHPCETACAVCGRLASRRDRSGFATRRGTGSPNLSAAARAPPPAVTDKVETGCRVFDPWSSYKSQQHDQRDEGIGQIQMDAPVLQQRCQGREFFGDAFDRQIQREPDAIIAATVITRMRIEGARQLAFDAEERLEDAPDRLTESFGSILHTRSLLRETAVPSRTTA